MPVTTYPGTVTPVRGLSAFTESERDVLFGRDRERDELTKLITGEGFRAGLLYGEPGVGKTSLLRAGLIPHLRDHGVIALPCDDIFAPAESFAVAASQQTGLAVGQDERPLQYLARIVSQALAGQQYLFILDEVDEIFRRNDDRVVTELGDLFARVVTRSAGRARFLFCCASQRLHLFGQLERRTGSLFPPSSRYELHRFAPAEAAQVLERTIALAGLPADRAVAHTVCAELGQVGPISPSDLQIAALALGELQIATVEQLQAAGGAGELDRHWIESTAEATGNPRAALRLLAELASRDGTTPYAPDWVAQRCGVDRELAHHAMSVLQHKGIVRPVRLPESADTHYLLAHEILAPRVRETAAPARATARRVHELLGTKAAQGKRLSPTEWLAVRREGLVPTTTQEAAVIERTRKFAMMLAGAIAATPIALLLFIYISNSGRYYLDTARGADGEADRIVVRTGRPGLSAFHWMGFGDVVADTGVTRPMVADGVWSSVADHDVTGDLDGTGYVDQSLAALAPERRVLVDYAITGDEELLSVYGKLAEADAEVRAAWLEALAPIARGGAGETAIVAQALEDPSPAVQTAALGVAASAARRNPGSYAELLASALGSKQAELRHLAFSAVRGMGEPAAGELFRAALAANPGPAARAELLAVAAADPDSGAPSATSAVAILASSDVSPDNRKRARRLLERAFAAQPSDATRAVITLVADHTAPVEDRVRALELIDEHAGKDAYAELEPALKLALDAKDEQIRAAALPLYARVAPTDAALKLVGMTDQLDTYSVPMRVAIALGWGEVARSGDPAAGEALAPMLQDSKPEVRAAAARAYGNAGRRSQEELIKIIKSDRLDVAEGAAWGLANSMEVGASSSQAVFGVAQLWKRKGKARRIATEVFARMAKSKSGPVLGYLTSASRSTDDAGLRPLGAEGLCNAFLGGSSSAGRGLRSAADDPSGDVRRIVVECLMRADKQDATVQKIAEELTDDSDPSIRADAARVLASLAEGKGKTSRAAADALVELVRDDDRAVRVIAVRGLAAAGASAPDSAAPALQAAFERRGADDAEKTELLAAARTVGGKELIPLALADESPAVRVAAIELALATGSDVAPAINAGMADADAGVRRATLERLAERGDDIDPAVVADALALATRDPDPSIAATALVTFARVGDPEAVRARLARDLSSPSESVRARAARACAGLVARDPALAMELLEPLLADPARDVRVAMLPGLAGAYAVTRDPEDVAKLLRASETHAARRWVAAAALVMMTRLEDKAAAAQEVLQAATDKGPPLARHSAAVAAGLVKSNADAPAFVGYLMP